VNVCNGKTMLSYSLQNVSFSSEEALCGYISDKQKVVFNLTNCDCIAFCVVWYFVYVNFAAVA